MSEYARVYLLDNPYFLDRAFEYYIPSELRDNIREGDFVTVPFGTSNRKRYGLVTALCDSPEKGDVSHKPIVSVSDRSMSLDREMLGLCFFIKEQTLCTVGDAVRAIIPASALSRLEEVYRPTSRADTPELSEAILYILEFIRKKQNVRLDILKSRFGPLTEEAIKKLLAAGLIEKDFELRVTEDKYENICSLSITLEEADRILKGEGDVKLRSANHIGILKYLFDTETVEIKEKELISACGVTSAQINALCQKGILKKERVAIDRSLRVDRNAERRQIILNEEQTAAYDRLCALYEENSPKAALLFGVTGSGKTSVMIKLIDRVLEDGKGAILLLPEISLTPQTLEIFCSRYGERVAIIHSGLSAGERFDTHKRIKEGRADVVIGTRSAIFAPLRDLGLIIIDEEQEHTYKSDMNPKYHTRDIARYRCAQSNALMVLASATPSFESYKKAEDGTYELIKLKGRYGGATLPKVTVADMRGEAAGGSLSPLGSLMSQKLIQNHTKGDQSVLFINRRGYNSFVSCRSCGEAIKCPECSVSMAYHTTGSGYEKGELRCHWCGRRMPLPKVCPACSSEHLSKMGYGTQRIEQELCELLPDANILRMDTDTTGTKHSYEEILGKFRRREADVLLGTQMVTKGHDFPDVTLVGVLLADASLYLDDYRAAERTFSMLTQVIGRAGRSKKTGEAVIQTNNPDNECIKLACAQDYESFYKNEIRLRRSLVFPPFCDIALLTLTSADEKELLRASARLSELLDGALTGEYSDVSVVKYGPFEAPVYKVEGKYRMRTVIKCRLNKRSRALLSMLLCEFSKSGVRGLTLSIDLNPSSL